jgi:hypothetical protein
MEKGEEDRLRQRAEKREQREREQPSSHLCNLCVRKCAFVRSFVCVRACVRA